MSEKVANREVLENNSRLQDEKVDFMNVPCNTHHRGFFGPVLFSSGSKPETYTVWVLPCFGRLESCCPNQSVR